MGTPVIAALGDSLNNFLNGGGVGTPAKTLLYLIGIAAILFAIFTVAKHALSSPPRLSQGVKEGLGSLVLAVLCLASPVRTTILNGAQSLVNDVIDTIKGGSHNTSAPAPAHATKGHLNAADPASNTITVTR